MDYKTALKNLNSSKVITILYLEELQTIAKELDGIDKLHEQIIELSQKLNSIKEEINKSEIKFRETIGKANNFDKLCNIIFSEEGYIFDFICLKSIDRSKNQDDFEFVKGLIKTWQYEKGIINGKK